MKILQILLPVMVNLKSFIFADGKFNKNRGILLAVILVICITGSTVLGVDGMREVIHMLDDLSDSLGYA